MDDNDDDDNNKIMDRTKNLIYVMLFDHQKKIVVVFFYCLATRIQFFYSVEQSHTHLLLLFGQKKTFSYRECVKVTFSFPFFIQTFDYHLFGMCVNVCLNSIEFD